MNVVLSRKGITLNATWDGDIKPFAYANAHWVRLNPKLQDDQPCASLGRVSSLFNDIQDTTVAIEAKSINVGLIGIGRGKWDSLDVTDDTALLASTHLDVNASTWSYGWLSETQYAAQAVNVGRIRLNSLALTTSLKPLTMSVTPAIEARLTGSLDQNLKQPDLGAAISVEGTVRFQFGGASQADPSPEAVGEDSPYTTRLNAPLPDSGLMTVSIPIECEPTPLNVLCAQGTVPAQQVDFLLAEPPPTHTVVDGTPRTSPEKRKDFTTGALVQPSVSRLAGTGLTEYLNEGLIREDIEITNPFNMLKHLYVSDEDGERDDVFDSYGGEEMAANFRYRDRADSIVVEYIFREPALISGLRSRISPSPSQRPYHYTIERNGESLVEAANISSATDFVITLPDTIPTTQLKIRFYGGARGKYYRTIRDLSLYTNA